MGASEKLGAALHPVLSVREHRALQAKQMTEATLQAHVLELANTLGWLSYHTHDSRRSQAGFPDLVMVNAQQGRVLYRELKSERGSASCAQRHWLEALAKAGQDAALWRPTDLIDGSVLRALRGGGDVD